MAAVKVDLPLVKSVKSGSVTVNKIMHGQNRIWPIFPIVLKLNDVYYDVTGIQNNEYQKTVKDTSIRCILGRLVSAFQTEVLEAPWHCYEVVFSSVKDSILQAEGGGDTQKDSELFHNGNTLYWDYMASNSGGSGFNRQSINVVSQSSIYDINNLTNIWYLEAISSEIDHRKYLRIKPYESQSWTFQTQRNAYTPNITKTEYYFIGSRGSNVGNLINLYYVKIYDKNMNVLSFCHIKQKNDNSYGVFDEISGKFLDYHIWSKGSGDHHEYDDFYPDKYIDIEQAPAEYYEVSGTITDGSDTFERLVNNKTGIVIKGIKIES